MSLADSREADKLIGTVFGDRYLVQSRLGKGGMAVVYKCLDKNLQRDVALKVLRTDVASDPVAAKRLIREARAAAALHHPNIITIHDVGERDGTVFLVMEVLVGKPMSDVMEAQGAVSVERAINMAEQVASALVIAHQNGIVHRDIKPENLFLIENAGGGDFIKMLDFSIAKLPTQMVTAALTRAGSVFGTPHYMAPEQVEGKPAAPQTDLYALGAVLHELIMGEPPFDGPSVIDILLKHARQPPPRIERAGLRLPAGLADLTQQMLAKKVQDRPASAALVRDRLGAMLAEVRHSGSENFTEEASQAMPVTLVPEVAPPPPAVQPPPPLPATARQSGAAARPPHAKREGLETWSQDAPDPVEPSGTAPGAGSDELHLHDVAPRKFAAFGGDDGDSEGSTLVGVGLANAIEEVAHRAKSGAVAPKRPSMGQPPAPAHPPATAAPHAPGPPHAAAPPPPGRRAPLGGVGASGVDASSAIQRPSLAGRTVARPPLQGLRQPPAPPAQPPPTFADNTAGRRANPQLHRQPPRAPSNKMPAVEINDRATTAPQIDADPATLQRSAADHDTIAPLAAAGARSNMLLYVAVGVAAIGLIGISVTVWLFTRGG